MTSPQSPAPAARCDYCGDAPVPTAGMVCWRCQSYLEYLENSEECPCPHDPNGFCKCWLNCEEDCPAYEYEIGGPVMRDFDDGEEWGQGREAGP